MKTSLLSQAFKFLKDTVDNKVIKFILNREKCELCKVKVAKWKHSYLFSYVCDDCVPRGCSCRLFKKTKRAAFLLQYQYKKDRNGKDLPCEDWDRI